ncbi:chitooligosaccharide synthase NodC [Paraburkholderia sp. BL18I3N2]|nr:chitooligosaccharide synthase NodC [Paraburkholderia sp. BL18I3N2]PRX83392.1 chitooligosaccharide synthase NodC [Paraburkholderia sp. BL25I1N1]
MTGGLQSDRFLNLSGRTRHPMNMLAATSAFSFYALLSTVYKSTQALYAQPTNVSSLSDGLVDSDALPGVDVIVPCFNEDPCTLSACLESIANQDYDGKLRVYVVDDGSANLDAVRPVYDAYTRDPRFNLITPPQNMGKRKAQIAAIRRSFGDLVLNVRSDTIIGSDVVTKLALKMQNPAIGTAMGQLTASNRSDTWLTRLIDMGYWLACNEERAAQARFGAVMCCCGPCTIYRRSVLLLLLDQYETQFFRGKRSDFGEDRHLTILMLTAGYRTEYVPDAIAATVVPDRLGTYLRQQLRWARSTYPPAAPKKIVTDQLRSYPAAKTEIPELANAKHVFVKACARVNNPAENSHQPTRECERRMRGFRLPERTQSFLSCFGPIPQHFAQASSAERLALSQTARRAI